MKTEMNENEIQQLMAQMKAESPDLPNQEIYNFLHANNFGSDADRYKHLFGNIKLRTQDTSVAAANNTFGTLAKDFIQTIKDNPEYSIPAAFLGGYAANKALPQVGEAISSGMSSLKNRFLSNTNKSNIVSTAADAPTVPSTIAQAQTDTDLNTYIANSEKAKADKIRYAQEQEAIRSARLNNQPVPAPVSDIQAQNQAAEFRARQLTPVVPPPTTPPPAPTSVSEAVVTGQNPTQALNESLAKDIDAASAELRTGTGKPAYAGQGPVAPVSKKGKTQFYENYGSLAEVPSTHAFVPNAQFIDPLRQDLGSKAYKEAYTVRNFPASNEIAREEAKTINRELGRATREEAKLAGLPPAEITPGITERTTKGYKKVVVGGLGAGALVALPNLASAAQQGDAKAAAEAIGYAIPGISQLLSVRDINKAYKEGGWPAAAHMAADVASMGGLSGAEHLLSYVPKQKTELPSINKPRLGAIPPAFSQYYR